MCYRILWGATVRPTENSPPVGGKGDSHRRLALKRTSLDARLKHGALQTESQQRLVVEQELAAAEECPEEVLQGLSLLGDGCLAENRKRLFAFRRGRVS